MPISPQNARFWDILVFFLIFSVKILGKDLWFFALCLVHQDASFELSLWIKRESK